MSSCQLKYQKESEIFLKNLQQKRGYRCGNSCDQLAMKSTKKNSKT